MESSLEAQVGPLRLERPTVLASGILGISVEIFGRLHGAGAGAIVSKSISVEPRDGYPGPTVVPLGGGGWINAVGLSNPGAAAFAGMIRDNRTVPIIVSLVGSAPEEFSSMVERFEGCHIAGYEINLSCPHVDDVGLEVGDDPELVSRVVRATKSAASVPVFAKVGLGRSDYLDTVSAAIDAGADGITAINTVQALAIDIEAQRPKLSNGIGGLSGIPIGTIAQRCVAQIHSQFDIPIMGCGGVSTWEDAVALVLAGASAVQLGSALGYGSPDRVFADVNDGIARYMERKGVRSVREMVGRALA
ncbi:MAG: dihydroorotate dehydrogenase [Thaumarchaeota archaeon]|nr:dihydroorotate dehydrogenase [Nitrososphaerota archaeon]